MFLSDQTRSCTRQKHFCPHIPNRGLNVLEWHEVVGDQGVAFLGKEQGAHLIQTHPFGLENAPSPVYDARNDRPLLGEVQSGCSPHVAPALHQNALAHDFTTVEVVEMTDRFCDAIPGDHVRNAETNPASIGQKFRVFNDLAYALTQVTNAAHFLGFVGLEMAIEHALLGVPNSAGLRHGNDLFSRVDVEVATCAVVMLEQWRDGLVPPAQHAFFAGIARVKIDATLRPPNLRSTDGELDLHGLGEGNDFSFVQAFAHPRSATCSAAAQTVDHNPSTGLSLRIRPLKNNFGRPLAVAVEQFFHHSVQRGSTPSWCAAKLPKTLPPQTSLSAPVTEANDVGSLRTVRHASHAKAAASLPSTQFLSGTSRVQPAGKK